MSRIIDKLTEPEKPPLPRGAFLVMSHECDQCLMTPQRIVNGRRAAEIIRKCRREDVSFICHKGSIAGREIACRGHFDTGVGQMSRIAERLGAIVEIDPDTMAPVAPQARRSTAQSDGEGAQQIGAADRKPTEPNPEGAQ